LQRRLAQAVLQQQRQHEHETAEEEDQGEVQGRPGRERPVTEQRQVQQRLAAPAGQPPFPGQREREDRDAGRQAGPGPRGPALVVPEGQRDRGARGYTQLRKEDVDRRFPGLLDSIINADVAASRPARSAPVTVCPVTIVMV